MINCFIRFLIKNFKISAELQLKQNFFLIKLILINSFSSIKMPLIATKL